MDRSELITRFSPPCHECESPVLRVETRWVRQGEDWVPGPYWMICAEGHRVEVQHFDS